MEFGDTDLEHRDHGPGDGVKVHAAADGFSILGLDLEFPTKQGPAHQAVERQSHVITALSLDRPLLMKTKD